MKVTKSDYRLAKLIRHPAPFKSCIDCSNHSVMPDPDPQDWFNDDDVRVLCTISGKNATVGCRPYNTRRETSPIPDWCPLWKK